MESKEEMRKNVDSAIKVHELEGFKFTTEEARERFREKLAGKKEAEIV